MSTGTATQQVVDVLGRVPLFQGLPRADLERIAELVNPREVQEGEFLFREGDPGDKFYIVFSGAVEILKERPLGDHERLAVKRSGEAFGEMSLLNDAPRSASVRAVEATRLLSVSRGEFDDLLGEIKAVSVTEPAEVVRPKRKLRELGGKVVRDPLHDDE